jgi:hypothetical protein
VHSGVRATGSVDRLALPVPEAGQRGFELSLDRPEAGPLGLEAGKIRPVIFDSCPVPSTGRRSEGALSGAWVMLVR